jgi:hypothetical protein
VNYWCVHNHCFRLININAFNNLSSAILEVAGVKEKQVYLFNLKKVAKRNLYSSENKINTINPSPLPTMKVYVRKQ